MQSLHNKVVHNHTTVGGQKHVEQRTTGVRDLRNVFALIDQIASLRHAPVVENLMLQTTIRVLRRDVRVEGASRDLDYALVTSTTGHSQNWSTSDAMGFCYFLDPYLALIRLDGRAGWETRGFWCLLGVKKCDCPTN